MEILRSSVQERIISEINCVKNNVGWDYYNRFWHKINRDLSFLPLEQYVDSSLSVWASVWIYQFVQEIVNQNIEKLINHATTPPASIGEYWLNKKAAHIEFGVILDIENFWRENNI